MPKCFDPYSAMPETARALWDVHDAAANLMTFAAQSAQAEKARLENPKSRAAQKREHEAKKSEAECWRELALRLDVVEGIRRREREVLETLAPAPIVAKPSE